jgi:hypothetical protein
MSDLQVAALGWLLMQNWFETVQSNIGASRVAVLHSSHFDQNRAATLASSGAHLGLGLEERDISAILDGPVFATDAKTGADYAAKEARDIERSRSSVTEDEIREVRAWISELARVSGLSVPLKQTL